jgi:hypothetical protein
MMIRLLYILLCIIAVYSCKTQTILEDDIYEAVENIIEELEGENWIKEGKLDYQYVLDKSFQHPSFMYNADKLFEKETIKKYFSIEDKKEFENQLEWYKDFSYQQEKIKSKKILHKQELEEIISNDRKSFWEIYISKYGDVGFYDISFPLFSADKKKMLVCVDSYFPYLNGGAIYLFTKENGKWKIKEVLYMFT